MSKHKIIPEGIPIPYSRQDISQADIEAVIGVLKSDYLTQGSTGIRFEETVASYCNSKFAVATNSATSALHVACLALDVNKGDRVWTTAITFVASANCALYCGASVDFIDIDQRTYNMNVDHLAKKLAKAKEERTLPKVVIPVHLCGQSCDMQEIYTLSKKYNFSIIEDASHAIGGRYKDRPVGNCQYSDITIFSFHPVKIITTGEGGMAVTNNEQLARRMRLYRSHGITSDKTLMQSRPKDEIWNYQQIDLGFNYRMTDIQAALGLSQMMRLDEFVEKRNYLAQRYDKLFASLPVVTPWQHPDARSSYHLYPIRLKLNETKKTQRFVYDSLHLAGVGANVHYIPVYLQPYYSQLGFNVGYCPSAEQYYSEAISLPLYSQLTEVQQDRVVEVIRQILA